MYIEKLKDNDWKSFEIFVKKNLVKSFISKKKHSTLIGSNKIIIGISKLLKTKKAR